MAAYAHTQLILLLGLGLILRVGASGDDAYNAAFLAFVMIATCVFMFVFVAWTVVFGGRKGRASPLSLESTRDAFAADIAAVATSGSERPPPVAVEASKREFREGVDGESWQDAILRGGAVCGGGAAMGGGLTNHGEGAKKAPPRDGHVAGHPPRRPPPLAVGSAPLAASISTDDAKGTGEVTEPCVPKRVTKAKAPTTTVDVDGRGARVLDDGEEEEEEEVSPRPVVAVSRASLASLLGHPPAKGAPLSPPRLRPLDLVQSYLRGAERAGGLASTPEGAVGLSPWRGDVATVTTSQGGLDTEPLSPIVSEAAVLHDSEEAVGHGRAMHGRASSADTAETLSYVTLETSTPMTAVSLEDSARAASIGVGAAPRAAAAPAGPDGAAHVAAAHLPSPPSARAFAAPGRLWL